MVVGLIGLGLASRMVPGLPGFVEAHAGDALWAAMVYWGLALLFPRLTIPLLAASATTFAFGIEFSQLIQHPVMIEARSHWLGALVLGHGFLWIDLVRYAVGIAVAAALDRAMTSDGGPAASGDETASQAVSAEN